MTTHTSRWRNSSSGYGWVSIGFHWLTALTAIALFCLGLWMVDLTYYDPWYKRAPDIHRSVGILLALTTLCRLAWRWLHPAPAALEHRPLMRTAARLVHIMLYALLFGLFTSGYLVSTAKGQPVQVFDWFSVPATITGIDNLEDTAGTIHELFAFTLAGLVVLHSGAALVHHFRLKDQTLLRMLKPPRGDGAV